MEAIVNEDVSNGSEFVQEIAYIVPEVETTCNICDAEFLDSEDLNVHVTQVHGSSTASRCQFCKATYSDLEDYARHIRDHHLLELKCCRCCTKCFIDHKKAKNHQRKHLSKSGMHACSQCNGLFTTRREVEIHELINHDNKYDGVFIKCMPYLSSLFKFKAAAFLRSDDKLLVCHSCDFTCLDTTTYFQHLTDNKCIIYVCDKCGDVFKCKNNLIRHFQRKKKCLNPLDYVNELTKCPTCKNDVHGTQMQAHLKFCKAYKCYTCDIQFETIDMLSVHQSQAHPSELDVSKCKYCPKEYVGQYALNKHIERTHQHQFNLYKYACKSCDAIFKHPQNLFAHYFTRHKELEPYTCKICDKKFRIRKRFTIHIKLEHKSAGSVEFDDQYHVFFTDKKSEKPFIPKCVIPELVRAKGRQSVIKMANVDNTRRMAKEVSNKSLDNKKEETSIEGLSDATSLRIFATETEPDEDTLAIIKKKPIKSPIKKKRKRRSNRQTVNITSSEEEDTEPLLVLKKRAERKRFQRLFSPGTKTKQQLLNQRQFTCKVCNKYCYTYQNYHNHLKIHSKNEPIECVKCSRSFMTKKDLTEHIATDHATSKLIETLKSLLERKQGELQNVNNDTDSIVDETDVQEMTLSEKFSRTIKKVKVDKSSTSAKIIPAPINLSVKKFIENFTPDVTEPNVKEVKSAPVISIKQFNSPFYRKQTIKMTPFTPEGPIPMQPCKLKMPERYKDEEDGEKIKLNVRLVQKPLRESMFEGFEKVPSYENTDNSQDYEDYDTYKNDSIPEVAQEVMLEDSEELPKQKPCVTVPQKLVIPKLPEGYPELHIATLQSQAPYFKIIKVNRTETHPVIVDTTKKKKAQMPERPKAAVGKTKEDVIKLPDGTKFVTANPLAHLLGDKPVEQVLELTKNRHYTPAITNFKELLAEALQNLDMPSVREKKPKKTTTRKKSKK